MNILFYHSDETCPTFGGIQRTTAKIAEGLAKEYGYHCYNVYDYPNRYPLDAERYNYIESRQLTPYFSPSELSAIIDEWKIDVIINQQIIEKHEMLAEAIYGASHKCRLIYCHHNTPKRLFNLSFNHQLLKFKQLSSRKLKLIQLAKLLLYPIYSRLNNKLTLKRNAEAYRKIYKDVARFVLLSHEFDEEWSELTGIKDKSKLEAIPNMLSFKEAISKDKIREKEKKVLLVARLVEFPKNVTSALRIWKKITQKPEYSDWSFDIIGYGRDEKYLKEYVRKHKIPRVSFLGRQDSEDYYERSSIFIMTSIREGWGMTLTESLQKGCLPIAFDSFASVHDIIMDGENGFLIPPFDEKKFASKLEYLMKNETDRIKMAEKGIESSKLFADDNILKKWDSLLREVVS